MFYERPCDKDEETSLWLRETTCRSGIWQRTPIPNILKTLKILRLKKKKSSQIKKWIKIMKRILTYQEISPCLPGVLAPSFTLCWLYKKGSSAYFLFLYLWSFVTQSKRTNRAGILSHWNAHTTQFWTIVLARIWNRGKAVWKDFYKDLRE